MLASRQPNQAIVHGICEHKLARVVTKGKVEKAKATSDIPVIARTKDYISYSEGSGVILFDHDKAREGAVGSVEALASYTPAELVAMLATVHPDIGKAAFVSTPSTSSCIYNAAGEMLRGEGTGSHTYLFVTQASDIPRYLKTLGKRLFIAGLGRIEISRSGSLLERTLVDLLVGSPERLDFVAGAVCRDGLEQRLPAPSVHDGEMLDTTSLPDLSAKEEQQYQKIVAALKAQAKPHQEKVVSEYIEREAGKLATAQGITVEDAKQIVTSRQDHILEDGDILYFAHKQEGVSVAEVLDAGEAYHGKSLADPLEPDYEGGSKTKAKFYWNDGCPIIHSFAHGSVKYRFRQFVKDSPVSGDDECDHSYYPPETLQALNDINKTYAGVVLGGDFRVAKEGFDEHQKKHTLSFLKITALYNLLANMKARVSVGHDKGYEARPLAKLWMEWDGRRTYEDIVFDPSCKCGPNVYNLFRGFPIEPKAGDWSLMQRHIREVICDGNEEYYTYLMSWMARIVQDPGGARPGVSVVLKGGKGIGKGVYVEYFGSIFGEAFLPISDAESFTGRFNMHLSKSLLVFLDEAVWGGDKKAEGKMKQLITERRVLFEPKGIDTMALDNHINVLIASNEDWVIPATGDERRFFVLNPNEKYKCDIAYFSAIGRERDNGGVAAMMHDLLQWDYRVCELRKAPKTEGLSEQVQESLPSVLDFWFTVLGRGYMLSAFETGAPARTKLSIGDEFWPVEVLKYEVFQEYIQWCKRQNERYIKTEQQFWSATWKFWPGKKKRVRKRDTQASSGFVEVLQLPHLSEIRDAFTAETRIEFCAEELDLRPFDNQF